MSSNKHKETLMLIDSHALLHRGYHAMSAFSTSDGRHSGAIYGFIRMIIGGAGMIKPDYVIACYDLPKPTFRHIAFDGYKGHRKSIDDELVNQIRDSKKIMESLGVQVCELEGFEADDLLGTFASKYSDKYNIAIVSGDMDTLQLVNENVKVYTLKKGSEVSCFGEKEVKDKYELEPKQIPDYKGLAGDASDNIPGVMGVGPKTAIKILKEYGTVENLYVNIKENEEKVKKVITGKIYETIKSSEEEAIFSKSLATIRLDAPLTLHLTHRWREGVNQEEYKKWCEHYELRSLRNAFEVKDETIPEIKVNVDHLEDMNLENSKLTKETKKEKTNSTITEPELHELQVMSILLNSEKIKASLEDIKILYGIDEEVNDFETIRSELYKLLEKDGKVKYFEEIEKPIMHLVELMRKFGIEISIDELHVQLKSVTEILSKLEKEIYKLAGKEFLISSPKQLGDVLYDTLGLGSKIKKTAGGQRSTNVDMLEKIKDEHAIVPLIMQWREILTAQGLPRLE
jgi:DNA polymerase-1